MNQQDYDKGFADGLLFVADLLRKSALIVEAPIRGDYSRDNGPTVNAVTRAGNPTLAAKFRDVAALLETATKD
jgi:hypothetical protein